MLRILASSLILVLLLAACSREPATPKATQGDFVFGDGSHKGLQDFRGRWVLVNYWAVWCKPCVKEVPDLNRLADSHREQLVILGVDADGGPPDEQAQHAARLGIRFAVLAEDPGHSLGHEKPPEVLPTTYVYAPDGSLRTTLYGDQSYEDLAALLGLE